MPKEILQQPDILPTNQSTEINILDTSTLQERSLGNHWLIQKITEKKQQAILLGLTTLTAATIWFGARINNVAAVEQQLPEDIPALQATFPPTSTPPGPIQTPTHTATPHSKENYINFFPIIAKQNPETPNDDVTETPTSTLLPNPTETATQTATATSEVTNTPTPTIAPTETPTASPTEKPALEDNRKVCISLTTTAYKMKWDAANAYDRENVTPAYIQHLADRHVDCIRVPLNSELWLHKPEYVVQIKDLIATIRATGMEVIADLHYDNPYEEYGLSNRYCMPGQQAKEFWASFLSEEHYGGINEDPGIMLEAFNEAHDVEPHVWAHGGWVFNTERCGAPFLAIGMFELADQMAEAAPSSIVLLGGLAYGNDHSYLPKYPEYRQENDLPSRPNVHRSMHPYARYQKQNIWYIRQENSDGDHPVYLTEVGEIGGSCDDGEYQNYLLNFVNIPGEQEITKEDIEFMLTRVKVVSFWSAIVDDTTTCMYPGLYEYSFGNWNEAGLVVMEFLANRAGEDIDAVDRNTYYDFVP